MLTLQNKKIVFNLSRCTQCGVCLAACPYNALHSELNEHSGLSRIFAGENCVGCAKCVSVCPAHIIPLKTITAPVTPRKVTLARHFDDDICAKASSGGAIRTIVQQALQNGMVNEAYLLVHDAQYPWAKGAVVGSDFEISAATNSMYLPILMGKNLGEAAGGKSILVVGTPCQLQGAFNLLKKRYETIYSIAVFCKQQKQLAASRHFAKRLGTNFALLGSAMQYRGQGWPGLVSLAGRSKPWRKMASFPYGQLLWRIPGCRACPDPFCLDCDISVADPWGIDSDSKTGRSMVMVWSKNGEALLQNAQPLLQCQDISTAKMLRSVEFSGIICKSKLAGYYAGKKVTLLTRFAGNLERLQIAFLEFIDKTFPMPNLAYRVLARMPLLAHIVLKKTKRSVSSENINN